MKKSQVTLIVIIGIVLLIVVGFFLFAVSNQQSADLQEESGESASFSLEKESFQQYFDQCARAAVIDANEEHGLVDDNEYRDYISNLVVYCMSDFLSELREKGFTVSTRTINTETTVFSKTISVNIEYPITVSYGTDSFSFEDYRVSFDRESSVWIIAYWSIGALPRYPSSILEPCTSAIIRLASSRQKGATRKATSL